MMVKHLLVLLLAVHQSTSIQQFPDSFYSSDSDQNLFSWLEYSEDESYSIGTAEPSSDVSSDPQQQVRNVHLQDVPDSLPGLDANRTYMDLYLCGQFMDLDDDGSDFSVITFDYAGYEIKFDPCEPVDETSRPFNFIYTSGDASASSDLKASRALPTMWRRYSQSNDGQVPTNIHFFSRKLPTKATIKKLVNFVSHGSRASITFFLAYLVEQDGDVHNLFTHIQPLLDNGIIVMKVCGRCSYFSNMPKKSSYRMISKYGMGRPKMYVRDGCPLIQPFQVPGEIYNGLNCDTFQGSLQKCASDFITHKCRLSAFGVSLSDVTGMSGKLSQVVYNVTKTCLRSTGCWKKESTKSMKIFDELIPVVCSFTRKQADDEIERCVTDASHLPFDLNIPVSSTPTTHFASVSITVLCIMAIIFAS